MERYGRKYSYFFPPLESHWSLGHPDSYREIIGMAGDRKSVIEYLKSSYFFPLTGESQESRAENQES
ncbi:hypothetical protein, partial [uncultured Mucilaginibacter sp.]|uniref:hypothetical protein n=1 Tax=uncultured Mucilaginibacter sp. TaxID=797541 RepID=UPI0025E23BAB